VSLSDFVGIPHADLGRDRAGCDCYGLLRIVYAEDLGIALPSFTGTYATCAEHAQIAALLAGEAAAGPWQASHEMPNSATFVPKFKSSSFRPGLPAVLWHLMQW